MRYSRTFPLKSLDPGMLLQTSTLGISGQNCSITVIYRYGGGLSHNVGPNSIQDINSLKVIFPNNPPSTVARPVRDSLETNNIEQAKGGDDAPSITSLKQLIPSARNSQQRLASKQDLLARIYTMPSNFGRVFRAAVVPNQNNPLSVQLHLQIFLLLQDLKVLMDIS